MPSLIATLGLSASAFYSGAEGAKKAANSLGASIKSSLGAQVAGVLSVAAIGQAAGRMLELGGSVQDMSNKLTMSTDAVQQWDYALKQNGSSMEAAAPFFLKLGQARKKALEGNDQAIADFKALGISLEMLKSHRVEDIAKTIAKGFEGGDPQQLLAPLMAVGGKGAAAMAAAFRDGLADALGEAEVIPQKDIEALDEAADKWGEIKNTATAMFAPLVADLLGFITGVIGTFKVFVATFVGAINGLAETIGSMSAADLLNPFAAIKKLAGGTVSGAGEGIMAVMDENLEKEAQKKRKRERLARGNAGDFDPEGIEEKDWEKAGKKAKADLEKKAKDDAAKAARESEKAARDEKTLNDQVQREADRELQEAGKLGKHSVGSMQQIGGFLGNFGLAAGPESQAMTAQIRSEDHLRQIKEHLMKKRAGTIGGMVEDVDY